MENFRRRRWTTIPAQSANYSVHEYKHFLVQLWMDYFLSWFTTGSVVHLLLHGIDDGSFSDDSVLYGLGKHHRIPSIRWTVKEEFLFRRHFRTFLIRVKSCESTRDLFPCAIFNLFAFLCAVSMWNLKSGFVYRYRFHVRFYRFLFDHAFLFVFGGMY